MSKPKAPNMGIIHLSDIHFSSQEDFLLERVELLFRALKDDFLDCSHIYVVVSGDIVNTGKASEYEFAWAFFSELLGKLQERYKSTQVKIALVPGNHDCDYAQDNQARTNITKNINYETIGSDESVIQTCLQTQANFWDFYGRFNDVPENKLYYRIIGTIADKKLCFHSFNTAWMMTEDNEKPGSLFFPVRTIHEQVFTREFDLNIAVLHHSPSWFNPNTLENNKKEFQNLVDGISSLQLIGHEHENELRKTENIDTRDSQTICVAGELLQEANKSATRSGFQTFFIFLNSNEARLKRYRWKSDLYQKYSENSISLTKKSQRVVELKSAFVEELNRINIPLNFSDNRQAKLSDIYIFPDLEPLDSRTDNTVDDSVDSEKLLDNSQYGNCILKGDSQIGKSSLLCMLFLKFYENGFYPILLSGKEITSTNADKIVMKAFESQYSDGPTSYEKFKQLDNSLKILLIDDLHTTKYIKYATSVVTKAFFNLFSRTLIAIDTAYSIIPEIQAEFKDTNSFSIKPLGFKKSNDLVEQYLDFREPAIEYDSQVRLEKTKSTFDQLRQILGDKLIPSYPVFVLSIVQALEYKPLNLNETSYGYCYQTLIHLALSNAGVSRGDVDSYINIITELAFHMFNMKTDSISESDFANYYCEYSNKFVAPGFETVRDNLFRSRVLKSDFDGISFGYKYILYFLAAKKIAEMIETAEGKKIVTELFDNLHKEVNANILVFITHHTRNQSFIEDSILTSMVSFDETLPITLERNCNYYKLLEEVAKEIKQDVIEMNRDPSEERKKQLIIQDKIDRKTQRQTDSESELDVDEAVIPFLQAFRAIEIVGQIIKNRKGSLEKETLKSMLVELYNTAFRLISYYGEMIKTLKDALSLKIEEDFSKQAATQNTEGTGYRKKLPLKPTNQEIEMKVYRFLQLLSLQSCLAVFTKLIQSIGVYDLREVYSDVARTMDTPAAKLVTFSMNSYYGPLDMRELKQLSKEFEDNIVAFHILRARAKSYVYNNHVPFDKKQKINHHVKMKAPPQLGHTHRPF